MACHADRSRCGSQPCSALRPLRTANADPAGHRDVRRGHGAVRARSPSRSVDCRRRRRGRGRLPVGLRQRDPRPAGQRGDLRTERRAALVRKAAWRAARSSWCSTAVSLDELISCCASDAESQVGAPHRETRASVAQRVTWRPSQKRAKVPGVARAPSARSRPSAVGRSPRKLDC